MENNKLSVSSNNLMLPKVSSLLAITNKLLTQNDAFIVKEIFRKNPKLFIDLISEFYPLNSYLITKYKENLNFEKLNKNINIVWSDDLLIDHEEIWDWEKFILKNDNILWSIDLFLKFRDKFKTNTNKNPSIYNLEIKESDIVINPILLEVISNSYYICFFWTKDLLLKYEDLINWDNISSNENVDWNIDLIYFFRDKWHWGNLSRNRALPWNDILIEKFKDKWVWRLLSMNHSINWDLKMIKQHEEKLEFGMLGLSDNFNVKWSLELLHTYYNRWNWHCLSDKNLPWSIDLINLCEDKWDYYEIHRNEHIIWSEDFISKKNNHSWQWDKISWNEKIEWSETFIDKFKDKFFWPHLISNKKIKWNLRLIDKYKMYFKDSRFSWWTILSEREDICWSNELIEKYSDDLDWCILSRNNSFPWSVFLIEKKINMVDFRNLSKNEALPWSEKFINLYENRWDWKEISKNSKIPWSIQLLNKYSEKLFASKNIWNTLSPYIDDKLIEEVFVNIRHK